MRCDGRKVSQDEPIYYLIPYFLTHRYDAMNMITVDIPEEPLRNYMNQKRKEGTPVNHMALLITAYLRTLDVYPDLNRFIGNKTIYEHVDKTVSMVVLKPGGGESMNKIELDDRDDLFAIQKKLDAFVDVSRSEEDSQALDKAIRIILKLRNRQMDHVCKIFDRFPEIKPFHFFDELNDISSCFAAKTEIKVLFGVHRERRRFFMMKRT